MDYTVIEILGVKYSTIEQVLIQTLEDQELWVPRRKLAEDSEDAIITGIPQWDVQYLEIDTAFCEKYGLE